MIEIVPEVGVFRNALGTIKYQPRYMIGDDKYGAFWLEWADLRPMTWRWLLLRGDNSPPDPDGEFVYKVKTYRTRTEATDFVRVLKMAHTWEEIPDEE